MKRPVSFDTARTTKRSESDYAQRPAALRALTIVLVAVACAVLALDAAMTPEQRFALSAQSGIFP
jgi:hypothetical protein